MKKVFTELRFKSRQSDSEARLWTTALYCVYFYIYIYAYIYLSIYIYIAYTWIYELNLHSMQNTHSYCISEKIYMYLITYIFPKTSSSGLMETDTWSSSCLRGLCMGLVPLLWTRDNLLWPSGIENQGRSLVPQAETENLMKHHSQPCSTLGSQVRVLPLRICGTEHSTLLSYHPWQLVIHGLGFVVTRKVVWAMDKVIQLCWA